jgi:cysteinyl-tRNA synthetase
MGLQNEKLNDDSQSNITNHLMELILEIRKGARADKNFAVSDLIRDKLKEVGIVVKDGKEQSEWLIEN